MPGSPSRPSRLCQWNQSLINRAQFVLLSECALHDRFRMLRRLRAFTRGYAADDLLHATWMQRGQPSCSGFVRALFRGRQPRRGLGKQSEVMGTKAHVSSCEDPHKSGGDGRRTAPQRYHGKGPSRRIPAADCGVVGDCSDGLCRAPSGGAVRLATVAVDLAFRTR
jgi:hypothetical protein